MVSMNMSISVSMFVHTHFELLRAVRERIDVWAKVKRQWNEKSTKFI